MIRKYFNLSLRFCITVFISILSVGGSIYSQDKSSGTNGIVQGNVKKDAGEYNTIPGDDEIAKAYRILVKNGNYEEKKKTLKIFSDNINNDRVLDIINNLLVYFYENPDFKENDQEMYYDDVIAEELIKIMSRRNSSKSFPTLLSIVLDNRHHRDMTVKAAWEAIKTIRW